MKSTSIFFPFSLKATQWLKRGLAMAGLPLVLGFSQTSSACGNNVPIEFACDILMPAHLAAQRARYFGSPAVEETVVIGHRFEAEPVSDIGLGPAGPPPTSRVVSPITSGRFGGITGSDSETSSSELADRLEREARRRSCLEAAAIRFNNCKTDAHSTHAIRIGTCDDSVSGFEVEVFDRRIRYRRESRDFACVRTHDAQLQADLRACKADETINKSFCP